MNIGIDASSLTNRPFSGVGKYVYHLLESLAALDNQNKYYVCYKLSRLKKFRLFKRPQQKNFSLKIINHPFDFILHSRLDLFHGTDVFVPDSSSLSKIATFHDIFVILFNDFSSEHFRKKKEEDYKKALEKADYLISISECTKRDLISHFKVPENKISVIYSGVTKNFYPRPEEEITRILKKYQIHNDYMFFVGTLQKRKNLDRLLEAYHKISKNHFKQLVLVLAGEPGWGGQEFISKIQDSKLENKVRLLGYVPEEDLPALYSGAKLFFFPSLYEGFGLPVLEALACGCPVLCSNTSAIPEVAGNAAILADPLDVDKLTQEGLKLLTDENLRQALRQKGFEQIKKFSWEKMASEIIFLYKKILSES